MSMIFEVREDGFRDEPIPARVRMTIDLEKELLSGQRPLAKERPQIDIKSCLNGDSLRIRGSPVRPSIFAPEAFEKLFDGLLDFSGVVRRLARFP